MDGIIGRNFVLIRLNRQISAILCRLHTLSIPGSRSDHELLERVETN